MSLRNLMLEALVPRLMAWKLATAFVLTAESWLGPERTHSGEEAVLTIGGSRHERLGVIRRVRKTPGAAFAPPEWLPADALDENYFRLLPCGQSIVTTEEATMLAAVFGEDGELPARLTGSEPCRQSEHSNGTAGSKSPASRSSSCRTSGRRPFPNRGAWCARWRTESQRRFARQRSRH
jgi:hypothetical protein